MITASVEYNSTLKVKISLLYVNKNIILYIYIFRLSGIISVIKKKKQRV